MKGGEEHGKRRSTWRRVAALFFFFILDRSLKFWAIRLGNYSLNEGFFWFLPSSIFFVLISFVYILFLLFLLSPRFGFFKGEKQRAGVLLIAMGGFSNLVDRIFYGGVIDFIKLPLIGVFNNLSDFFIFSGFVLLLVDLLRARKVS